MSKTLATAFTHTHTAPTSAPAPSAPPVPVDPLRTFLSDLRPEDDQALQEALLTRITRSLAEMDAIHLQETAQFVDALEHCRGCTTPAEELIRDLVRDHYLSGGLTPELVTERLEGPDGFRANFQELLAQIEHYAVAYPKLRRI